VLVVRAPERNQDPAIRDQVLSNVVFSAHREHIDTEQNCKKFAILCQKEVKRKLAKSQKNQKEHQIRAKKLHREMVVYWRKREKELNEIRKRKEKLEAELKRREEEEREVILHKKRLEFLMKQSDLYAHFMAKKLGIVINHPSQPVEGRRAPGDGILFRGQVIEINEEEAANKLSLMINEQRQSLAQFDKDTTSVLDHHDSLFRRIGSSTRS